MTITIFSCKTFKLIVKAHDVEEYNVFLSDNNWVLGIEYFNEAIEQTSTDAMILCPATSENAYDDIFIVKTHDNDVACELLASDQIISVLIQLYADHDLMTALWFYLNKKDLNEIYGKAVTELSKSELKYADTDRAAAGDKQ